MYAVGRGAGEGVMVEKLRACWGWSGGWREWTEPPGVVSGRVPKLCVCVCVCVWGKEKQEIRNRFKTVLNAGH